LVPPLATGNVPVTPVVKLTAGIVTVALDASNVAPAWYSDRVSRCAYGDRVSIFIDNVIAALILDRVYF
jgi:hypothetical protein